MAEIELKKERIWSVIELLNATREFLVSKEFQNPRTNAELLLGHALGLSRIDLYLKHDRPVTTEERAHFRELLTRRLKHEPLQYIVGETEYYSVRLRVTPDVLIPRPETEIVAEKAIEAAKKIARNRENRVVRVLDIGTGAGNLAIALAVHLPQVIVEATDISEKALDLANENAARTGVASRVHLRYWDIFSDKIPSALHPPYSLVVSNPPYVAEAEFDTLPPEIKNFEPKSALISGPDDLRFYRRFAELVRPLLETDGALVVEIGETQADSVHAIFKNVFKQIEVFPDISGADRVVVAEGLTNPPGKGL